ncbi:alpha/beta hydrolase family esterase [Nocardia sp. alder85J]|uniref:extracellular catalytic domain type 1 short-chain-length polyhydroxyalkanoate depolymerase n=1 Tax=Nocardia sp. alder85J TaxID=2862949 RepID=UPI001CD31A82|nr:PHB depolymerase family esterase [Nocardia sp. alder85J]MCX4091021.1 esterase [Nocardia sp. alder85J]
MMRRRAAAAMVAVSVGVAVGSVAGCAGRVHAAEGTTVTLDVGGHQREYLVHAPARPAAGPLPVVLAFHGGGGTAQEMERDSGFDQLSDAAGFIAVYPAGYERSWSDTRGADTKAGAAGIDDVGFVSTIIDRLIADDHADPARIYATGMSNGAIFTEDLGCRLAGRIAAIAPVAGTLSQPGATACQPAQPVSVLEIHGTGDPIVPYNGGPVRVTSGGNGRAGAVPVLPVDANQQQWRTLDGCTTAPAVSDLPDTAHDGTTVTVSVTTGCRNGSQVQLYSVTDGGHTWPGGRQYLPQAIIGKVSHQFDAAAVIWQFFGTL